MHLFHLFAEIQEPIDEVNHLSSASVMEERRYSGTEKPNQMSGTLGEIKCIVALEEKIQSSSVKGPCAPLAPEEPKPEDECDHVVSAELHGVGSERVPVNADSLTTSSLMVLSEDPTRDESEKVDQEVVTASGELGLEEDPQSQDGEVAQGSNVGSENMPRNIGPSSSGMQEEDTEVSAERVPEELNQSAVAIEEQTLSEVALMDADTSDKGGEGMPVGKVHPEVATDEGTLNGEVMQAIQDSDIHPKVSVEESTQVGDIVSEAVMDEGTCDQGGKDSKVSIQPDAVPGNSDHSLSSSANADESTDLKIPESNWPEVAVEENIQSEETRDQGGGDTQISNIPNKGGSVNMDLDLLSTAMPEGKMEGTSQEISAEMNQSEAASDVKTEAEVDLAQGSWGQGGKDHHAGELDPVCMSVNLGLSSSVLAKEDNDGSAGMIIGEPSQSEVAVHKQIQDAGAILPSSNLDVVGGSKVPETAKASETELGGDHVDHSQASPVVPESTSVDSISVSPSSPVKEGKEIEGLANTDPENASTNLVPPSSSPIKEDANIIGQAERVLGDDTVGSSEAKLEEKSEGSLGE